MRVSLGRSYYWFFGLLFGGLLGAAVLYVLEGTSQPGGPGPQPGRPVGLYLTALGVALVPAALIPALRARGRLKSGAEAHGTVVGAERKKGRQGNRNVAYYHPKVRFATPDGRTVLFTSAYGSESEPEMGYPLKVRYSPDDPSQAEVDSALVWAVPAAMGLVFGLGLLVAGIVVYARAPQVVPAAVDNVVGAGQQVAPSPEPLLRQPEAATGRSGDQLTVYDATGDAQEVTVARLVFSTGDQLERPQRGLYMGAFVQVHALTDGQDVLDLYALVDGHQYGEAATGLPAFDPLLGYVTLDRGQRASGWLVFDVPGRHGRLVLRDQDEHKVGVWTY